jgi:UDP-N-acetylglucosamine--N-acetylmuramyl-(pentapeptide) pyrophosphoryl-undecaprenol N-acetylglucosamine transferase
MVAVAQALRAEDEVNVVFVGTGRGIETRVIGEAGEHLELLDVLPLRGRGVGGFVRGAVRALMVLKDARALVRRIAPDVVFSVGGYAAGPVTLAARSSGVPVTLLEPNAAAGFTNRVLAPLVVRAYVCFPETKKSFREERVRWTGVPLRSRFEPAPYAVNDRVRVLVMGGSQGALALNEAVPKALAACMGRHAEVEVVHQTGKGKDAAVRELYHELGIEDRVTITTFIDDVAGALAGADIVVERAGAGSLAELCAVGRPAILVPYPYAADDHQRHNAQSLERDGAAVCVVQKDATPTRLESELERLIADPDARKGMAERAAARGRPDAAKAIARDLLDLARARGGLASSQTRLLLNAGPLEPEA